MVFEITKLVAYRVEAETVDEALALWEEHGANWDSAEEPVRFVGVEESLIEPVPYHAR